MLLGLDWRAIQDVIDREACEMLLIPSKEGGPDPEALVGHTRHTRSRASLDHVILCVDQSGSMATSVVYSSIFAAVMA
jgi:VWA domain containing CoxE-like protein